MIWESCSQDGKIIKLYRNPNIERYIAVMVFSPELMGFPKFTSHPYRIIISSVDSPLYSLATFLHGLIKDNILNTFSHIENSFQLIDKLKGSHIDNNHIFISLDVISLFTNIPIDLAIESILNRWDTIKNCHIPQDEFINALKLVLNFTFFTFDKIIYKQNFGTLMGSPLSPIISDLVMRDLEERSLETLNLPMSFYVRYVDDIAMTIPPSSVT